MIKKILFLTIIISLLVGIASASYTSQYPPAYSDTYVKATTTYTPTFQPYYAVDPSKSLTGTSEDSNAWMSNFVEVQQRFHVDLGSAKTVTMFTYANYHNSGSETDRGVKTFTLWGSNTAGSFADLTYGTDTGWTQLTTNVSQFDQHVGSDTADLHYVNVTNSVAYRYYAFKFEDGWGTATLAFRHIELQTTNGASSGPCLGGSYGSWTAYGDGWITRSDICTVIKWNTSGTYSFQPTGNATSIDYVVVAGGGGGGYRLGGGGGGAGGFNESSMTGLTGEQVVIVGAGGAASTSATTNGANGGNSSFGNATVNITSIYGSGGGTRAVIVVQGASTGGGGGPVPAATTPSNTSIQEGYGRMGGTGWNYSYTNYQGGGGGGFISNGSNAGSTKGGNGGNATKSNITGNTLVFAGGGGGGMYTNDVSKRGLGGSNSSVTVGGSGSYRTTAATAANASSGSGGGGSGSTGTPSAGASGSVYIRFLTPTPIANFTANVTSGTAPLPVMFNDTSTNTSTAWNWSFTNLTGNATEVWFSQTNNVTYTFGVGNFSIKLNASNSGGWNNSTQVTIINVSGATTSIPIVQWTLNKKMVRAPGGIIIVNDTSLNTPTSWDWYWGDGTANSTTNNATHKYTKRGVYQITLNATNAAGSNISESQQVRSFGYEIYIY
jgi:PKD repeat protein